ncbi:amino acid ABC transporter substrate-binding protein [Ancylobacter sonchi]|uniref:substrate-binding periplasmic protein n=1 Tax=Ancylobacter sonchi TaxID=1937790 RepID=UPI001BD475BD|nr:transporter substrate-binding domain-containing protein [Ancylobacter sonchi]MBS7532656.1 amino acid ABC transporter substrate-binding protein [Ancylobacter sonchi]
MKSSIGKAVLAAVMLVSAVSAGQANCLDDIKKAGVITAGNGLLGTKPFVWKNEDGSYAGFEWEMFQELGKRLGVPKQDYVITEWTSLIPGLKVGRWDIILSGMAATQERIQGAGITFSKPYFLLYDYVIVPKDSPIKSMDDLKGKTLASTLGTMDSLNAHNLVAQGKAAKVQDFNDFGAPFLALRNGQVDAVVMDQATMQAQIETMGDLRQLGEPIFYQSKPEWAEAEAKADYILGGTSIGVRKECPELLAAVNDALTAMDADGTRKAILSKYGAWAEYQAKTTK